MSHRKPVGMLDVAFAFPQSFGDKNGNHKLPACRMWLGVPEKSAFDLFKATATAVPVIDDGRRIKKSSNEINDCESRALSRAQ